MEILETIGLIWVIVYVGLTITWVAIAVVFAERKNRSVFGWVLLVFLFSPLLFVLLVLNNKKEKVTDYNEAGTFFFYYICINILISIILLFLSNSSIISTLPSGYLIFDGIVIQAGIENTVGRFYPFLSILFLIPVTIYFIKERSAISAEKTAETGRTFFIYFIHKHIIDKLSYVRILFFTSIFIDSLFTSFHILNSLEKSDVIYNILTFLNPFLFLVSSKSDKIPSILLWLIPFLFLLPVMEFFLKKQKKSLLPT